MWFCDRPREREERRGERRVEAARRAEDEDKRTVDCVKAVEVSVVSVRTRHQGHRRDDGAQEPPHARLEPELLPREIGASPGQHQRRREEQEQRCRMPQRFPRDDRRGVRALRELGPLQVAPSERCREYDERRHLAGGAPASACRGCRRRVGLSHPFRAIIAPMAGRGRRCRSSVAARRHAEARQSEEVEDGKSAGSVSI